MENTKINPDQIKEYYERANSFLEKHIEIGYRQFIEKYNEQRLIEPFNEIEYLSYLVYLDNLEKTGKNIGDIKEEGRFLQFNSFLQDCILGVRVEKSLSKFPNVRCLKTLVSEGVSNKMIQEDMHRKIFIGKKYYYSKLNTTYDLLFDCKDISELPNINFKEIPVVPYFDSKKIHKPQMYFLSINKLYPEINKFFLGSLGKYPYIFSLIYSSFEEGQKTKMFAPASYIKLC